MGEGERERSDAIFLVIYQCLKGKIEGCMARSVMSSACEKNSTGVVTGWFRISFILYGSILFVRT